MPDQPANIKLFRAKHRDKWHYLAETVAIRSNPVLIAPCGFESNGAPVFVETFDCPSDQLPVNDVLPICRAWGMSGRSQSSSDSERSKAQPKVGVQNS
jgi:hypothetical protein